MANVRGDNISTVLGDIGMTKSTAFVVGDKPRLCNLLIQLVWQVFWENCRHAHQNILIAFEA